MNANPKKVIEVFADIICPFTHVGLKRLVDYRQEIGRTDVAIRARAWPIELVNGELLSRDLLVNEIAELRRVVAPEMFAGFVPEHFPMTSLPALALGARAYRVDLATGERVSRALRDAVFEEGRDISDSKELAAIGQTFGISADESDDAIVRSDYAEGQSRGVVGSPHFFVENTDFFCPSLEIEHVEGSLQVKFDPAGFTEFMDHCFYFDPEPPVTE